MTHIMSPIMRNRLLLVSRHFLSVAFGAQVGTEVKGFIANVMRWCSLEAGANLVILNLEQRPRRY